MKSDTALIVGLVVVGGLVAYYLYSKNSTSLTIGKNGVTGQINVAQLASAASGIVTSLENNYSGGSSSVDAGYGDSADTFSDDSDED